MNGYTIKSVVRKIYSIDYNNIDLGNNTELIISKKTNDFHQLLFMNNELTNTYLIPHFETETKTVQTGLFYKDNSIYNHPIYGEPLISFRLSLTGIKPNTFYRVKFVCSGIETYDDQHSSKVYIVLNGKDIIHNKNIGLNETSIEHIYLSDASLLSIAVTFGKVYIKDIIFEEVEVMEDVHKNQSVIEIPDLMNLKSYAVLKPHMLTNRDKVISKFPLIRGIGINVLYNRETDTFIIERNKENDVIQENIALNKYLIDIKSFNSGSVRDVKVDQGASPFSGYNGYSTFKLSDADEDNILYILIYELL